jgi:(E)-4-hydroxy-3-methylbut-2-enyl-diphosphate synthase
MHVASQVEIALETLAKDGAKLPRVAVMGCAVNGPGEAKGADIALCGGDGEFLLYVKGKMVCKVSEQDAARKVTEYAVSI